MASVEVLFGGVVVFPDRQDDAHVDEQEDVVLVDLVGFLKFFAGLQVVVLAQGVDALVEEKLAQLVRWRTCSSRAFVSAAW